MSHRTLPDMSQLIAALDRPVETDAMDFKERLEVNAKSKAEFVKDVAAMANNGGGTIVFGVRGTEKVGISTSDFQRYDTANLHNWIKDRLSPAPTIVSEKIHHDGKDFFFVFVSPPEDAIVLPIQNTSDDVRIVVNAGTILHRRNTQSVVVTSEPDLRRMLDKIVEGRLQKAIGVHKAIQDQLAQVAANLVSVSQASQSPAQQTQAQATGAVLKDQVKEIGVSDLQIKDSSPRWEIELVQTQTNRYQPSEIANAFGNIVDFGGDNFPLLGIFNNFCAVSRVAEGFLAKTLISANWKEVSGFGLDGNFSYRSSLLEDFFASDRGSKVHVNAIDVLAMIRKIAFVFYYLFLVSDKLKYQGEWKVSIRLCGVRNRRLYNGLGMGFVSPKQTVSDNISFERTVRFEEHGNMANLISDACVDIFNHFNWATTSCQPIAIQEADKIIKQAHVQSANIWFVV